MFQEFNLLPTLTARENVEIALMGRGFPAEDRRELAETTLARVGLGHRINHLPHAMSGGERQRVAIARAIVNTPRLLLADEPTGNLDSANADTVAELLFNLQRSGGMTLVLVTHDEDLAERCQRCVRMRDGKVVADTTRTTAAAPAAEQPVVDAPATIVTPAAAADVGGIVPHATAAPTSAVAPPIAEATAAIARTSSRLAETAE